MCEPLTCISRPGCSVGCQSGIHWLRDPHLGHEAVFTLYRNTYYRYFQIERKMPEVKVDRAWAAGSDRVTHLQARPVFSCRAGPRPACWAQLCALSGWTPWWNCWKWTV